MKYIKTDCEVRETKFLQNTSKLNRQSNLWWALSRYNWTEWVQFFCGSQMMKKNSCLQNICSSSSSIFRQANWNEYNLHIADVWRILEVSKIKHVHSWSERAVDIRRWKCSFSIEIYSFFWRRKPFSATKSSKPMACIYEPSFHNQSPSRSTNHLSDVL